MRKDLLKCLLAEFASQLGERLPQFERYKAEKLGPGRHAYEWKFDLELTFFVLMQTGSRGSESFTIELAFSQDGMYPDDAGIASGLRWPYQLREVAAKPRLWIRLAEVWTELRRRDYWWWITPEPTFAEIMRRLEDLSEGRPMKEVPLDEALENVKPTVADAIDKVCQHGIRYFLMIAEHRHVESSG